MCKAGVCSRNHREFGSREVARRRMEQWAKSLEEPRRLVSSFAMTLSECWRQSTRRQASTDSTSDAGVTNQSNDIFWRVGDRALTVVPHIYLREGSVPLLWLAPDLSLLSLSLPYPGPFIYTFICMYHNSLPKSGQLK